MLVHANELDASISIWAVLSAAMPYEFCEHMLYETGYHEITGYKEGLFMEAFNKVFDTKQKEKLVLGFYKNLYTCEAFKMLCKEAKEAREKKNAALTAAELCALQSKKNWEVSSSYLWFTQLFSKKVEYLRGVHGKCRKVFDIVCINDGFLHLPCLALYYDATKTIDDHKIETTYDLHSIDLTNKQARYITELDVRAIQSIASMHTVKHWLRLQIDLSDNAQIDWQALQKLRFLSNEGPIDIQFKTNRYTPGEYSLVADNAYMQIIRGLGVRAFAAVCGLLLLYKLLAWDDKIGYKHYCNKLETVSNTIAPEVKSHAVYLAQQTHKVLPGKSVYLPRGLDWRSVKAQYPTDTKQVTNALLAINQLTAIDSQYDILCQKTDFFEGVTAAIGLVGGLCAIFLNVFDPCNRVIPDGKGGIKSSKWKYLRFIGSPPIACDIEFEKKT
jgi:hypothetical protein